MTILRAVGPDHDRGLAPYAIESVDNAMQILLMLQRHESVRVTQCSDELGVARSTAHRLLMTMANRGFLQQARNSRAYFAGPALMEFVFAKTSVQKLRMAARGAMEDLAALLGETVNLMVLEPGGVRFIECVECDRLVRVSSRTGGILPAHATAGGKLLLSTLSEHDLEDYLAELKKLTPDTITDSVAIREQIEDIAVADYAINRGESLPELRAISVLVRQSDGEAVAALAVSVPAERGTISSLRRFLPAMRETSARIASAL